MRKWEIERLTVQQVPAVRIWPLGGNGTLLWKRCSNDWWFGSVWRIQTISEKYSTSAGGSDHSLVQLTNEGGKWWNPYNGTRTSVFTLGGNGNIIGMGNTETLWIRGGGAEIWGSSGFRGGSLYRYPIQKSFIEYSINAKYNSVIRFWEI